METVKLIIKNLGIMMSSIWMLQLFNGSNDDDNDDDDETYGHHHMPDAKTSVLIHFLTTSCLSIKNFV